MAYTRQGGERCAELTERLSDLGHSCKGYLFHKYEKEQLEQFTDAEEIIEAAFECRCAVILICAVGIAVRKISGFVKSKLSIARALASEPAILLADEPTGALDSASGQEVLKLFGKLNQMGNTIVMITHDLKVAKAAQRIVRIVDGCLSEYEEA